MLGDMDFLNTFVYPRYCEDVGTSYSTNGSAVKGFSDENSSPRECGKNDRTLPHPGMHNVMITYKLWMCR